MPGSVQVELQIVRILMVGAGDPPPTFIQRQIHGVRQSGAEVTLLPGLEDIGYTAKLFCRWGMTLHIPRYILEHFRSADIVHFQWPMHLINYFSLAKAFSKPVVLSLRGRQVTILPHVPGKERYAKDLKKMLPLCDAYHCVSENIMLESEKYGLEKARARVIRTAVDPEFFKPRPSGPDNIKQRIGLVSVEVSTWRKGGEYLLSALRLILDAGYDVRLSIVDVEGDEKDRILYTARDLGVEKSVDILGKLPPEGIRNMLWENDIYLLSSLSEGISNSVVEAMACALPVVTTDCGGMREAVTDGAEGFVVPCRDPKSMASSAIKLIDSKELRSHAGQKAREKVLREFSLKTQAEKFMKLYSEVLER